MASRFAIETIFSAVDKLTAPVGKMRQSIRNFGMDVTKNLGSINKSVDAFNAKLYNVAKVALVSLGASAALVTKTMYDMGNQFGDMLDEANRLDLPIEDLQKWRFIGDRVGVSNGELSSSLRILSTNLGKAKNGQGQLFSALSKSNPALLRQLRNAKDVGAAFDVGITALRNTTKATDRAALATALFGKSGGKLINIAKMSAAEIEALRVEMTANGIVTAAQAAEADAFAESMDSLKGAFMGVRNSALLPLMAPMTELTAKMREYVIVNREVIGQKVQDTFKFITDNATNLYNIVTGLTQILGLYIGYVIAVKGAMLAWWVFTKLCTAAQYAMVAGVYAAKAALWVLEVGLGAARIAMMLFNAAMMLNPIGAIIGLVTALTVAAGLLIYYWEDVAKFFSDLWDGITDSFMTAIDKIKSVLGVVLGPLSKIFGGAFSVYQNLTTEQGGLPPQDAAQGITAGMAITPAEQISHNYVQSRDSLDVNIFDGTGMARVTKQPANRNTSVNLQPSGAF